MGTKQGLTGHAHTHTHTPTSGQRQRQPAASCSLQVAVAAPSGLAAWHLSLRRRSGRPVAARASPLVAYRCTALHLGAVPRTAGRCRSPQGQSTQRAPINDPGSQLERPPLRTSPHHSLHGHCYALHSYCYAAEKLRPCLVHSENQKVFNT